MNKIILVQVSAFCLFSHCLILSAAAQTNYLPVKHLRLDSVTAIGKPNSEEMSQEIGKEGGNIFSGDGRIELIFPEGALTKKKKIIIQPVTNHAVNGRGSAYKMAPSGLQFVKPVTIVFHYSNETTGTQPELIGIAWQDEKGKWEALQEVITDTIARTITSQIHHFSSYTSFDKIVLMPSQGRVKVEKTKDLWLSVADYRAPDINGDELPPLPTRVNIPEPVWSVNGIPRGDQHNGWITGNGTSVVYNAPRSVPTDNPVAVTVQLKGLQFVFNRRVFKDPMLVSHLLVYDKAYRISIKFWGDDSELGICTMRMVDYGEFTLVMEGTRSMIREIVNQNLQIGFNPCACPIEWTNRLLTRGPINIIGANRIDVTPASIPSTPFPKVKIFLKHAYSQLPKFNENACDSWVPNFQTGIGVFLPLLVEFEANNEPEQKLTLAELTEGTERNSRADGVIILIRLIEEEE
jgi:hypothetical protein